MEIGRKICYGGGDARVEGAAVGEVSAETHSGGADPAIAGGKREEGVNC